MLINIQSNALKFTEEDGQVTIMYSLYKLLSKSYLEIQVKDTGQGIRKNDRKKLFKLFGFIQSTAEVNTKGIGLGLAISKDIIEQFGGSIGFTSQWEKGSIFSFRMELKNDLDDRDVNDFRLLTPEEENPKKDIEPTQE